MSPNCWRQDPLPCKFQTISALMGGKHSEIEINIGFKTCLLFNFGKGVGELAWEREGRGTSTKHTTCVSVCTLYVLLETYTEHTRPADNKMPRIPGTYICVIFVDQLGQFHG